MTDPIRIGDVEPLKPDGGEASDQPAVRVLERAAELLEAYKDWDEGGETDYLRLRLFDRGADVIQATADLLASMNALDYEVAAAMKRCRTRNEERRRPRRA